ncbi:MAG: hypothetical protein NXH75_15840 [Halobacteriovoraceae bacterium]|nr:hypothetical protein [Halobacteriovoraceae bacterium]
MLICQVAYSYFGGEAFPFSTFNVFSNRKTLKGQVVYRAVVSLNPERYEQEGIFFHVSKGIKFLHEERKLPLSEIENYFKFPIYAIDKFTLKK